MSGKGTHRITKGGSKNKSYVGICHNKKHYGPVTIEVMCEHQCLEKGCHFFEKVEHPLWTDKTYTTKKIKYKQLKRLKDRIDTDAMTEYFKDRMDSKPSHPLFRKDDRLICVMCGKPITKQKVSLRLIPARFIKWTVPEGVSYVGLLKQIPRYTMHNTCVREDYALFGLDVDKMWLSNKERENARSIVEKFTDNIERYKMLAYQVLKKNKICPVCNKPIVSPNDAVIRRIDGTLSRNVDNALCVHNECVRFYVRGD